MALQRLDHVNIRTRDLDRTIGFYRDVLGLKIGPRPDFDFPGARMYLGDDAVVHLIGVRDQPRDYAPDQQLEHFAFSATGLEAFLGHLRERNISYWCRVLPGFEIRQVNLLDCDGNHLHVDFPKNEDADLTDFTAA